MASSLRDRALVHVKRLQDSLEQGSNLDVKSLRTEISSLRHLLDTANSVDLSGLHLDQWRNRPRTFPNPGSENKPLLIVKYGPPGSGKSTEAILRPLYRYILGPERYAEMCADPTELCPSILNVDVDVWIDKFSDLKEEEARLRSIIPEDQARRMAGKERYDRRREVFEIINDALFWEGLVKGRDMDIEIRGENAKISEQVQFLESIERNFPQREIILVYFWISDAVLRRRLERLAQLRGRQIDIDQALEISKQALYNFSRMVPTADRIIIIDNDGEIGASGPRLLLDIRNKQCIFRSCALPTPVADSSETMSLIRASCPDQRCLSGSAERHLSL